MKILHSDETNATLSLVKSVGKFAVLLLTLSIFASPLMACLQPDSTLTDEERECCRQMAGDCEGMPASHSCCKTTVRDNDPYLNSPRFSISEHPQDVLAVLPIIKMIDLAENNS